MLIFDVRQFQIKSCVRPGVLLHVSTKCASIILCECVSVCGHAFSVYLCIIASVRVVMHYHEYTSECSCSYCIICIILYVPATV